MSAVRRVNRPGRQLILGNLFFHNPRPLRYFREQVEQMTGSGCPFLDLNFESPVGDCAMRGIVVHDTAPMLTASTVMLNAGNERAAAGDTGAVGLGSVGRVMTSRGRARDEAVSQPVEEISPRVIDHPAPAGGGPSCVVTLQSRSERTTSRARPIRRPSDPTGRRSCDRARRRSRARSHAGPDSEAAPGRHFA